MNGDAGKYVGVSGSEKSCPSGLLSMSKVDPYNSLSVALKEPFKWVTPYRYFMKRAIVQVDLALYLLITAIQVDCSS